MTLVTQSPGSLATATHPPSLLHALSYIALVREDGSDLQVHPSGLSFV